LRLSKFTLAPSVFVSFSLLQNYHTSNKKTSIGIFDLTQYLVAF